MDAGSRPSGEELKRYITDNIDRAVEEGWITAYYQPVVRILTGEICGMEALARWIDPRYGMFPPDDFIGVLEEARLIHKLDSCIIKRICDEYSRSVLTKDRMVTISFNLSRYDFRLMDVHNVIEEEIKANKVPRDALRVEITESMMDSDDVHLHDVIDRFWERGLRVWMDDFGSGYSSLNVLKDYRFDTLKIDMVFLRNFNAKSREIVKSVVDMSKRIGVHTLAEGVETAEQLEFLKEIGCEKAQGYYIGKPMPYAECLDYLKKKEYVLESPAKRQYYHDIGKVNVLSATPLRSIDKGGDDISYSEEQIPIAFIEYSGNELKYLFVNDSYKKALEKLGVTSLEAVVKEFGREGSSLRERFISALKRAKETDEVIGIDFVREGNYCYAQVRAIAGYPGGNAFLCILNNLSEDLMLVRSSVLNAHMRSLCSIYEMITLVDLNTGYSEILYSSIQTENEYSRLPAAEELKDFAQNEIYPEDRDKFVEFTDLRTIERRISESPTRHISAPFRTRGTSGTYVWSLYSFLFDGDRKERRILSCFRRLSPEAVARLHGDNELTVADDMKKGLISVSPESLWNNFKNNSDTGFFWKDKERRFLGVNKKFLTYYDLPSEDVLIGKTDEDMGWHVDPGPFKSDEERVIAGEGQTYLVPGTCICKGEIRNILASKFPLYVNGEIVGLMGYFIDVSDWKSRDIEISNLFQNDPVTGTLNFLGLMEALLRYQDGYAMNDTDFVMIMFDVSHFHLFRDSYGNEWSHHLLKEIGDHIRTVVGVEGIAGRLYVDRFMLVKQCGREDQIKAMISAVESEIEKITEVDGIPCTVYMHHAYTLFSEAKDLQVMFERTDKMIQSFGT